MAIKTKQNKFSCLDTRYSSVQEPHVDSTYCVGQHTVRGRVVYCWTEQSQHVQTLNRGGHFLLSLFDFPIVSLVPSDIFENNPKHSLNK